MLSTERLAGAASSVALLSIQGIWLQTDVIVNCIPETLLASQVSLRRLDGDVTQQKLNLLQFTAGLMAQSCTGPS